MADFEDLCEDDDDILQKFDYDEGSESEMNPHERAKLLKNLDRITSNIKTAKKGKEIRREASKDAAEFVVVKRKSGVTPTLNKLLESVKETGEDKAADKINKLVKASTTKSVKTLEKPLERPQALKTKREVLYDNAKKDVSRWNAIVYHNRLADQLVFPFNAGKKASRKTGKESTEDFIPMTPLEEEMAKVLYGEEYLKQKKAQLEKPQGPTNAEAYMLSVEEALANHSEMSRLRALQNYQMAKAKRQNKIKSKKYHRLLRKEKIKKQLKEFETLQKTDPEAALVKLEELENSRVEERMSLKHRNTSKWAKMQSARAKYNKDSRVALSEQLKISQNLTQKVQESSSEDEDLDLEMPHLVKSSVNNPWMLRPEVKDNDKLQLYYTGYKKLWDEMNTKKTKDKKTAKQKEGDADEIREFDVNPEEQNIESFNGKNDESSSIVSFVSSSNKSSTNQNKVVSEKGSQEKGPLLLNPNNFLKVNKNKSTIGNKFDGSKVEIDWGETEDVQEEEDKEESQRMLIAEAFEDDDVVEEFKSQKEAEIEASKPKDIDLHLPGWGEWGGKGVKMNPRKRQRFTIKSALKQPPRKDANLSHVILNQEAGERIREHQVRELPFPFKRVKDFERTIRAPIGRTWMPEQSMKSLTAPKIITRLGSIIKPLNEDVLVKTKEGHKSKDLKVPLSIKRLATVKK